MTGTSIGAKFRRSTALVLLVFMLLGAVWNIDNIQRRALDDLKEKSAVIAQQILAVRSVIARNQNKINYDSKGHFEFKHLNPAAIGQQVNEEFNGKTNYFIKQTRINARNLNNQPDAFEMEKLKQFSADLTLQALWGEDMMEGKKVFRYMIPLYMEKSCLDCHGQPAGTLDVSGYSKEGLEVGELAGAISITSPMVAVEANIKASVVEHLVLTVLIIGITGGVIDLHSRRFITNPLRQLMDLVDKVSDNPKGKQPFHTVKGYGEIKELANSFGIMAQRLEELYNNLETKVVERTCQLSLANENLKAQHMELKRINEELARVSGYKSEFLANMSHELRTPLTSILAFTEMLLKKMTGDLNEEQQEYLQDIYDSGSQLMNLINQILDLSKNEAGRMSINKELVLVEDIVIQVCRVLKPQVSKKNQHLKVNLEKGLSITADREKIYHILMNLCGNAIKFTEKGGTISINATEIKGANKIALVVADNGMGIKEEYQTIIFEQFKQLDSSMDRKHYGTGLGLALVKKLVDLHGGTIQVESCPGKGSTFTVLLPTGVDNETQVR
ncbi:MAG: ATP-binding protein [Thermincolia bacterium]